MSKSKTSWFLLYIYLVYTMSLKDIVKSQRVNKPHKKDQRNSAVWISLNYNGITLLCTSDPIFTQSRNWTTFNISMCISRAECLVIEIKNVKKMGHWGYIQIYYLYFMGYPYWNLSCTIYPITWQRKIEEH